ncbi:MAG: hypothetical protein KGZ50_03400 [Peptococcaceae bacterium]|nr:hypothetical protein [Peptococcaceae bacterium]
MNIVWHYLDKKTAAVNALRDYSNMEFIIEHTDESIAAIYAKVESPRSSLPTGMPKVYNRTASENRLASCIDEIDILKERYRQALEYMEWFKPAWEMLDDASRFILHEFFVRHITKTEAVLNISEKLHIERSWVYKRKEEALRQLTLLLYGL